MKKLKSWWSALPLWLRVLLTVLVVVLTLGLAVPVVKLLAGGSKAGKPRREALDSRIERVKEIDKKYSNLSRRKRKKIVALRKRRQEKMEEAKKNAKTIDDCDSFGCVDDALGINQSNSTRRQVGAPRRRGD